MTTPRARLVIRAKEIDMTIKTRMPQLPPTRGAMTIYLSEQQATLARYLGDGNASAGVRLALALQPESLLDLAAKLPSGRINTGAPEKLAAEMAELRQAIAAGDRIGAALEAADVVYYAVKAIALAADLAGISRTEAFAVALAKYRLRARDGNPKDDAAERAACREAIHPAGTTGKGE